MDQAVTVSPAEDALAKAFARDLEKCFGEDVSPEQRDKLWGFALTLLACFPKGSAKLIKWLCAVNETSPRQVGGTLKFYREEGEVEVQVQFARFRSVVFCYAVKAADFVSAKDAALTCVQGVRVLFEKSVSQEETPPSRWQSSAFEEKVKLLKRHREAIPTGTLVETLVCVLWLTTQLGRNSSNRLTTTKRSLFRLLRDKELGLSFATELSDENLEEALQKARESGFIGFNRSSTSPNPSIYVLVGGRELASSKTSLELS